MKERRKYDGNNMVFDYKDLMDKRKSKGKVLVKMKKGPITYKAHSGTKFFRDHPYMWVSKEEADSLLSFKETDFIYFVESSIEEVEDFYAI